MRRIPAMLSLVVLGLLTACGGGNDGGPKQDITVSVAGGQTQTIRATILKPADGHHHRDFCG